MATLRLVPVSGSPIEITDDQVSVGRDPGSDILLKDGSVSRKHARIEKRGDAWAVVDQASANGTFLDSQRVADVGLRHGHELRFGAVSFLVEIPGQEQDPAATVMGAEEGETVIGEVAPSPAALPRPPRLPPPPSGDSPPPPPSLPPPPLSATPGGLPPAAELAGAPAAAGQPGQTKLLYWVGGGCCGCLTIILLVAAVAGWFLYRSVEEPATAVKAQLEDIKGGRMEKAYERLDGDAQDRISAQDFELFVARHPAIKDNRTASFSGRSVENDIARLSGTFVSSSDDEEQVTYRLRRQGGQWRIAAIEALPDGAAVADALGRRPLHIETIAVDKQRVRGGVEVTLIMRVSGFGSRSVGDQHEIDLAGDLETLTPEGDPVDGLWQENFHRLSKAFPSPIDTAELTTKLTFPRTTPPGTYTVRLRFRDLVGGAQGTEEAPIQLP